MRVLLITVLFAGQLVTSAAQLVMVISAVLYKVTVVGTAGADETGETTADEVEAAGVEAE